MKPILFNTTMVKKTLSGGKTATRRVVKPQFPTYKDREPGQFSKIGPYGTASFIATHEEIPSMKTIINPPYLPGDILYVREKWRVGAWSGPSFPMMAFDFADGTCGEMVDFKSRDMFLRLVMQSREDARKANCEYNGVDYVWGKGQAPTRWRPSIHMPKEAARIFLRVTDVHAERLWESFGGGYGQAERFQREGITLPEECTTCIEAYGCPCCSDLDDSLPYDEQTGEDSEGGSECGMLDGVRNDFALLWDSTIPRHPNKFKSYPYRWADNPWVWVIKFERCEKPKEENS